MLPYVTSEQPRWAPMLRFLDLPDGSGPFSNLDGNSAVGFEGPYVCVVPVRNFYLLSPTRAQQIGEPWVLGGIPPEVVEHAAAGRCLVVLDLSNEGAPYVVDVFESVYEWADGHGIPRRSLVLVTQNRNLEAAQQSHVQDNGIGLACYDYFVLAMAELFALDDDALRQRAGFDGQDVLKGLESSKDLAFLCLNATARPHRVAFAAMLRERGLLPDVLLSFHGNAAGGKSGADVAGVLTELRRLDALELERSARFFAATDPIYADEVTQRGNELHDEIHLGPYVRSAVSLVTETEATDGEMRRVTEKTVKAVALGHPTVVFGNPGSLPLLHEFGFQTFAPVIDESYDGVTSGRERFQVLADEIVRLRREFLRDPRFLAPLDEICRFNIRHAREGLWATYRREVEEPLVADLTSRFSLLAR